jgi:hypothetical protein
MRLRISLELFNSGLHIVLFANVTDPVEATIKPRNPDRGQGNGSDDGARSAHDRRRSRRSRASAAREVLPAAKGFGV